MASLSVHGGAAAKNVGNQPSNATATATVSSVLLPAQTTLQQPPLSNVTQQGPRKENGKAMSTLSAESSMSNPYAGRADVNTASVASWSVIDPRRRPPPTAEGLTFNAYDPSGQLHTRQRIPSTTEQTSFQYQSGSVSQTSQPKASTSSRPPVMGAIPRPSAPTSGSVAQTNGRSDWAKPVSF